MSRHSVSVLSSSVIKRTNSGANRTRAAQDRPATRTLLSNLLVACSLLFLVTACVKPLVSPDLSAAWEMTPLDSVFLLLEVDEHPVPVGGLEAALQNVHYPSEAWRQRIQGVVLVEFVVDEKGVTRNHRVLEPVHGSLDQAAMLAIRLTRFVPGRKDGRPARVLMSLPITFRLK